MEAELPLVVMEPMVLLAITTVPLLFDTRGAARGVAGNAVQL